MTNNLIDIKKELREKAEEELPVWFSDYTSTVRADIFKFIDVVADTVAQGMKEACELEEWPRDTICTHYNAVIRAMHEKVEAFMKPKE